MATAPTETGTGWGRRPSVDWEARRAEVRRLEGFGLPRKEIAERMGVSVHTLASLFTRRPRGARKDAWSRTALKQVRLCDVPMSVRLQAAHVAAMDCETKEERESVFFAALFPSDKVYWVPQSAKQLQKVHAPRWPSPVQRAA